MGIFTFQNNLKRIFTGSLVQIQALEARLHDCKIKTIAKNHCKTASMYL